MIHPPRTRTGRRAPTNGPGPRASVGARRGILAGLLAASVLLAGAGLGATPDRADDLPANLHPLCGLPPAEAPSPGTPAILLVAGDIAESGGAQAHTAAIINGRPVLVQTLGDNAYESGSALDYATYYQPTWGVFTDRTHPAPGNHEYETNGDGASGYYGYFGDAATPLDPGCPAHCLGYYAYDLGDWHVVVLNSECFRDANPNVPNRCAAGSPQERWLEAELAAHPGCQIVATHHPRWSSDGTHGNDRQMQAFWQAAADAGVEVYLAGHAHDYERFAPMDGSGTASPTGVREIVVGTGGADLFPFDHVVASSEVRNSTAHGVLELTLYPDHYEWRFLPVAGQSFTDAGEGTCH